jgi:hypothetical protein
MKNKLPFNHVSHLSTENLGFALQLRQYGGENSMNDFNAFSGAKRKSKGNKININDVIENQKMHKEIQEKEKLLSHMSCSRADCINTALDGFDLLSEVIIKLFIFNFLTTTHFSITNHLIRTMSYIIYWKKWKPIYKT